VDAVPAGATTAADGVRTQLLSRNGEVSVHCSAVVDLPPERVWSVITGYDRFSVLFPMLDDVKAQREPEGVVHLTGVAHTPIGRIPFETRVMHSEHGPSKVASWSQSGGALRVNKGSWVVTPEGAGARVEYSLAVEVVGFPAFVVRAGLRRWAPQVVERAIRAAREGAR